MKESIWMKDPSEHEILVKKGRTLNERNQQERVQEICREESPQI